MKTFRVGSCYEINGQVFKMIRRGKKIDYSSEMGGFQSYTYCATFEYVNDYEAPEIDCIVEFGMSEYSVCGTEAIVLDISNLDKESFGKMSVYPDKNRVKYNPKTDRYER